MQVVILCGGSGTRLREQTEFVPKPMVQVGGKPMLWHIMSRYSHYGFNEFILALGYKQEMIKTYFYNFDIINNDIRVSRDGVQVAGALSKWDVILCDTGPLTMKGGRLKKVEGYISGDNFMMTYGDGIADIDIGALVQFHLSHGRIATVAGVHPTPRFGEMHYAEDGRVTSFTEKPEDDNCLINGGFFVFRREIFEYLTDAPWCDLECGPLELLAAKEQMMVYAHHGYWGCMDTMRDMEELNQLWNNGEAKWKV